MAATVMLVRPAEGAGGFDVFMLRRSAQSAFVPDVYVFPGGTLDPQDSSPEARARTRGLDGPGVRAAYRAQSAGLMVTALRELFEEAGVLLACDADGRPLGRADLRARTEQLAGARQNLQSGEMAFADILAQLDLYADASALTLFSRWITPPSE
ncbi:MAG: NUDIX hydrolase, partial [Vulcanimicrobiaceae bacterium]